MQIQVLYMQRGYVDYMAVILVIRTWALLE